jgi:hypothetical protein
MSPQLRLYVVQRCDIQLISDKKQPNALTFQCFHHRKACPVLVKACGSTSGSRSSSCYCQIRCNLILPKPSTGITTRLLRDALWFRSLFVHHCTVETWSPDRLQCTHGAAGHKSVSEHITLTWASQWHVCRTVKVKSQCLFQFETADRTVPRKVPQTLASCDPDSRCYVKRGFNAKLVPTMLP